jgi:hypothetical protein
MVVGAGAAAGATFVGCVKRTRAVAPVVPHCNRDWCVRASTLDAPYSLEILSVEIRLWNAVDRRFRKSDIGGAVKFLEERLAKEKVNRFKGLLAKGFTNTPQSILSAIDKFIDGCAKKFAIKAVYLEMNGFDINPDRWYFDSFGYAKYTADPQNVEWLCEWQSPDWPQVTLKGLEAVQKDFEWYHAKEIWNDKKFERAYELAVLLVTCKFVSLVESALAIGTRSKVIPVLATAHDFDIVGRFEV